MAAAMLRARGYRVDVVETASRPSPRSRAGLERFLRQSRSHLGTIAGMLAAGNLSAAPAAAARLGAAFERTRAGVAAL